MVLADDNFASITAAVREGRTVYNNIEKALLFMLPTNVAQALVILVAIVAGFILPITAPQILWVNMVTSVALGLVISFEPHELDVMQRTPRAVSRPILDGFALWRVIFVGVALLVLTLGAFFWMKAANASDELARTVAVNTLVVGQIFYLLNSRFKTDSSLSISAHLGNPYLPLGIAAVVVLQLLFTYAPPLQRLFGTEAISLEIWPRLFLGGFVFFLVVEAEKFVIRTFMLTRSQSAGRPAGSVPATQGSATERPFTLLSGRWQAALGAVAVAALIGGELYVFWRHGPNDYATPGVDRSIATSGEVLAPKPREVLAPVSGRIVAILCKAGSMVEAGQICAKLDPTPFEQAVAREKTILAQATQQQEASAAAQSKAKRELERRQQTQGRSATARAALEKARVSLERATARVDADRVAVEQSRAAVAAAEATLAQLDVAAPVAGAVISTAAVGDLVEGGKIPAVFSISPTSGSPDGPRNISP